MIFNIAAKCSILPTKLPKSTLQNLRKVASLINQFAHDKVQKIIAKKKPFVAVSFFFTLFCVSSEKSSNFTENCQDIKIECYDV
jgi:hypothetical protein